MAIGVALVMGEISATTNPQSVEERWQGHLTGPGLPLGEPHGDLADPNSGAADERVRDRRRLNP